MNFWNNLDLSFKIVAWLFAGSVAVWKFWGKKKYEHYKNNRDTLKNIIEYNFSAKLDTALKQLVAVNYQLYPNGGNNLIGKVEKTILAIADIKNELRITRELMEVADWQSDSDGRVIYVSNALCELIGCTPKEALDRSWVGMVCATDRDRVFKEWMDSIANASDFDCIYSYIKSDGLYQKVQAIAMHTKDDKGNVLSSMGRLIKIGEPYKK